jgi:hypothetical protein
MVREPKMGILGSNLPSRERALSLGLSPIGNHYVGIWNLLWGNQAMTAQQMDFGLETLQTLQSYISALANCRLSPAEKLRRYRLALKALKGEHLE